MKKKWKIWIADITIYVVVLSVLMLILKWTNLKVTI